MFKNKTLFILGAGASLNYGYPLGKDLINEIIQYIEDDYIYIPIPDVKVRQYQLHVAMNPNHTQILPYLSLKLPEILSLLRDTSPTIFDSTPNHFFHELYSLNGLTCTHIKLSQIPELESLRKALVSFDPVSIDAFLNNNRSHELSGKIMIVYSLLKCEDLKRFSTKKRLDLKIHHDNWYSYLIQDILAGCKKPADVLGNNLNIITFNYDLSLEYCLSQKLPVEMVRESEDAQRYISELISKNTHHVYGKLYDYCEIDHYGKHSRNGSTESNTARFQKALQTSNSVRLINEERESGDSELYESLILKADKIIVIGFGFDRDNLDILRIPSKVDDYHKFAKKKICYMDYEGKMKSLAVQFKETGERFGFSVTRSVSTSISEAYQNDFKIYLY